MWNDFSASETFLQCYLTVWLSIIESEKQKWSLTWKFLVYRGSTPLVFLLSIGSFSPPARWGLLDFMSVAWSSSSSSSSSFSSSSSRCPPRPPAQLRLAIHSVLCRTSTTTIHAQCSLPDLNHDHPRPVFPAGPQPRPSPPSVPCRTSTTTIHAQCSLPDLNREYPRQVFPAGPHEICQIECQKICQMEC